MKRFLAIVWFVVALLAACNSKNQVPEHGRSVEGVSQVPEPVEGPTAELCAIDSLLWRQPDSALACLLPYFDTCREAEFCVSTATAYNRHYANLLLSELLYKNDYPQTNRVELLQAVDYFDSLMVLADTRGVSRQPRIGRTARRTSTQHIAFLDARTHYINGVGYYENDSAVDACKEYMKALEVMEEHFSEKELIGQKAKFMSLAYTRLTVLFSKLYLNKQAIYFGKHSLPYYEKYETQPWHLPWMLSKIGAHYSMMKELDSAQYYYQQALTCLPDTINQTYRDIATRKAFLLYEMENNSEKAIVILHHIAGLAKDDNERSSRYLSIGEIYYYEKQFDSAKVYFEYVCNNTLSSDSHMLSLERLREISMAEGDTLKANEYALECTQFAVVKDEEGKLYSDLTTLCQLYEQSRQENMHKLKDQKTSRRWSIILALVVFIMIAISILLLVLRRRMKTEQFSHKMEKAAISGRLRKSNEALRNITEQFEHVVAKSALTEKSKTSDDYVAFMNVSICQHIIRLVHKQQYKSKVDYLIYKDDSLSKEQLLALRDAAEKHLVLFTSRIRKQFPNLTESDMDYCYLFLLGLNEADISVLMQRAYSTVCERSRKINRIIEAKGDLYHTLRNLLCE